MTLKNCVDGVDLTTYAAAQGRKMENYVAADVRTFVCMANPRSCIANSRS